DIAVKAERVAEQARGEESKQRANAEKQTEIALAQKKEADRQRGLAEDATKEALDQKGKAETARGIAGQKESEAVEAQKREELAAYGARIGMAAAKVEENAFDTADRLLADCKPAGLRNWEWGYLKRLSSQGMNLKAGGTVTSVAFSADGRWFVTA